ncbi:hypothetical protein [Pimelobacter simplex]|uniref:hypothetical protein n=1 Tax=Nocardioides simplex TaxID=2045 RepID=UPI00214F66A8|nr:hypothetical protein [Pimelobacter simplex]UUW89987.1 hypothetical protein M0M43_00455 [Pimelobacter simplex]UUW93816.1 hypothetical protein M0M48_18965 [Pimelobacter simplex]
MSAPAAAVTALVPGVPALLPSYASLEDPVADLRAACRSAVGELGPRVRVLASGPSGLRVGAALVADAGASVVDAGETGVLVVGNGSAKRTEKAPGHLDERAAGFDAALRTSFAGIDPVLAAELWADAACLGDLPPLAAADVRYDDAPFGVQYWVAVWA